MELYVYAVLFDEVTAEESTKLNKPALTKMLVSPTYLLAKDAKMVTMTATRAIPKEYEDRLDRIRIAVSPF